MNTSHLGRTAKRNLITYAMVVIVFIAVQIMSGAGMLTNSLKGQLVPICCYIIMAVSLNLTVGILGELSLGHAGFMSVGAFSSAFFSACMKDTIQNPWVCLALAIVIGAAAAGVAGLLVGIPVLRLQGDYLAIVTLAFGEIIKNILNSLYIGFDSKGMHFSMKDSLSLGLEADGKIIINGAQGISGMPKTSNFIVGFILIILTLLVVLNFIKSRSGRAVMSIRDNRIAAESVGINITKYKLIAFSVSAALAGAAGALYAHNYATLVAKKFDYNTSILILVFVVVGGMGNIRGSIIAAAALTVLPELLRSMNDYRMLIYAIVLIVMMIFNQSPQLVEWRQKIMAKMPWKKAPQKSDKKGGK